ncbi:MAG TPA: phage minor head protein [Candidatus Cybelea sp.]
MDVIVELNGTSLKEARRCAHRMLERTNSVQDDGAATPRPYKLHPDAEKLERARMRIKVAGTRKLRLQLLAILDAWRSKVVAAVRRSAKREADVGQLDDELAGAVDAGVLTEDQRQAIIAAVTAALASMDPKQISTAIAAAQEELFQAGLESAKAEVGITWDLPPTIALDQMAAATIPFSQEIVDREVAAISQALQDGIAAGEGIPKLAQRIQDSFDDGMHILDDDGNVKRVIPNDSWAEMVARTETARAMNAGVMQTYRAAGVARIMWIAAEDERTCPKCSDLDGEIVPLGAQFDDGIEAPPDHLLCRCTVVSAGTAQPDENEES